MTSDFQKHSAGKQVHHSLDRENIQPQQLEPTDQRKVFHEPYATEESIPGKQIPLLKTARILGLISLLILIENAASQMLGLSQSVPTSNRQILLWLGLAFVLYAPLAYLLLILTTVLEVILASEEESDAIKSCESTGKTNATLPSSGDVKPADPNL